MHFGAQSRGLRAPCERFAPGVTPGPRITRFRLAADLGRMGLDTHRVSNKVSKITSRHLVPLGKTGLEAEVFLYDTLPGGAGFSTELAGSGHSLFRTAVSLLQACPENCDSSCYRCLRSFRNKLEHGLLDRHVGAQLLEYLITGELTDFSKDRLRFSTSLLYNDLRRQAPPSVQFSADADVSAGGTTLTAPILAQVTGGRQFVVALSAPLTPGHPADPLVAAIRTDPPCAPYAVLRRTRRRGDAVRGLAGCERPRGACACCAR